MSGERTNVWSLGARTLGALLLVVAFVLPVAGVVIMLAPTIVIRLPRWASIGILFGLGSPLVLVPIAIPLLLLSGPRPAQQVATRCRECGYNLQGHSTAANCPECGTAR